VNIADVICSARTDNGRSRRSREALGLERRLLRSIGQCSWPRYIGPGLVVTKADRLPAVGRQVAKLIAPYVVGRGAVTPEEAKRVAFGAPGTDAAGILGL
jgi:hypothetical protein